MFIYIYRCLYLSIMFVLRVRWAGGPVSSKLFKNIVSNGAEVILSNLVICYDPQPRRAIRYTSTERAGHLIRVNRELRYYNVIWTRLQLGMAKLYFISFLELNYS